MLNLKMASNVEELFEFYGKFQDALQPEMAMAVNRFAHTMNAHMRRHILKTRLGIVKEDFDRWKIAKRARPTDLEAEMVVEGRNIPLVRFVDESKIKNMEGSDNQGGVEFNLFGETHQHPKAFISDAYTGKHRVLFRKRYMRGAPRKIPKFSSDGKRLWGRAPMFHLHTVSVPQIADDDDVVGFALVGAKEQFIKQLDHTISRMAEGLA